MILKNVHIIGYEGRQSITIGNETIKNIQSAKPVKDGDENEWAVIFDKAIAFPGLINSHDHLEFIG